MVDSQRQNGSSSEEIMSRLHSWFSGVIVNEPVYLVGGGVRDILMGLPASDLDLAAPRAEKLAKSLARANWAGLVRMEKAPKAPCYRVVRHNDPENYLDVVGLRGPDIESDLADRDFTINAMAITFDGIGFGQMVDPLNGRKDIAGKVIRSISLENLEDDPLRILRGFRFSAQLAFSVDHETLSQFSMAAPGLARVAAERVSKEILLTFECPESLKQVEDMDRAGVLELVFPELAPLKGVSQNDYHHEDVWNHTLSVFRELETIISSLGAHFGHAAGKVAAYLENGHNLAVLKLAALYHDAGKPRSKGVKPETGAATFYGHEKIGAEIAKTAAARLRMSKADAGLWELWVAGHLHAEDLLKEGVKEKTIISWFRRIGEQAVGALILAMADAASKDGSRISPEQRQKTVQAAGGLVKTYYASIKERLEMTPLLSGGDLLALGIAPGPEIGRLLALVQDARDEGLVSTRQEALQLVRDRL